MRNDGAAPGVKGEKMGGGEGVCDNGAPLPPPIFSPFSLSAARHSAADVRRRQNLQLASVCINGEAAPPLSPVYAASKHTTFAANLSTHP